MKLEVPQPSVGLHRPVLSGWAQELPLERSMSRRIQPCQENEYNWSRLLRVQCSKATFRVSPGN